MQKCPICSSGTLKRQTLEQTFEYKNNSFKYMQPADHCDNCGEGILTLDDINQVEAILHDFCSEVDGYLSTKEVRRIRRKLKLTQKEAAKLFGGGHNAFSRYERGENRHPKSLDLLLRILDKNPQQLLELQEAA